MGALHGLLRILTVSGARATFIKCHHDVSTYLALDIHHVLGGEHQFTTINMGRELHAFFGHFANIGEGEYLKTARIGQYGACPSLKTMQSARFVQDLGAWSQIQVIGVTQNDLGINIFFKEGALHSFHSTDRAYGHKNGGLYIPMVGMHHSCACTRVRICMYKVKESFIHSS